MLKATILASSNLLNRVVNLSYTKKLFLKLPFNLLKEGSLTLNIFGETHRFDAGSEGYHAELTVLKPFRAYWLIKTQGELGFAQAYFEKAVNSASLYNLMMLAYTNEAFMQNLLGNTKLNAWDLVKHKLRHNSVKNSRKNISYHYDLGNSFYKLWLDKSMTYSSGLFLNESDSLLEAQKNKYQRLINSLDIKDGDKLLEVGCGWGGLMEAALDKNVTIKGLTLSEQQKNYAELRLLDRFSPERFEVALQDYRHEEGIYDHLISIEMFEAVGKDYWDTYFAQIKRNLKKNGKAALQIITIRDDLAEAYQSSVDFIQAYIFPGGLLPSLEQLQSLAAKHGFDILETLDFGQDYAKTCSLWKADFNKQSAILLAQGYDAYFQRMWNYYLDYCIVGFETKHISVVQLTLRNH